MDSFWLPEGMTISSIAGSESDGFELSKLGSVLTSGSYSGRIGQSVINNEESLPSQGPKWQKHNHTAAVKVRYFVRSIRKK
jgi:hypothetical protein